MGRQKQEDSQSLARQPNLVAKLQVSERLSQNKVGGNWEIEPKLTSGLYIYVHICIYKHAYMRTHSHTKILQDVIKGSTQTITIWGNIFIKNEENVNRDSKLSECHPPAWLKTDIACCSLRSCWWTHKWIQDSETCAHAHLSSCIQTQTTYAPRLHTGTSGAMQARAFLKERKPGPNSRSPAMGQHQSLMGAAWQIMQQDAWREQQKPALQHR